MTENNPDQVTVTDKRRNDPETGEVRHVPPGAAPGGAAPDASGKPVDKVAELTNDLQRVQADFANYRKRALRDQQTAAEGLDHADHRHDRGDQTQQQGQNEVDRRHNALVHRKIRTLCPNRILATRITPGEPS